MTPTISERYDVLRTTFITGKVVMTQGIAGLNDADRSELIEAVQKFNNFNEDNDPHKEHDFGKVVVKGVDYFWKIDDYRGHDDMNLVLTIMRADEY